MAKKTLSEQIAELANKPKIQDFDIEDEDFQVGTNNDEKNNYSDDNSDEGDDEETKKQHYVKMGTSKLRSDLNDDVVTGVLRDTKYTGLKGSRDALFGNGADKQMSSGEEEEEEEEGEEEDEEDEEDEENSSESAVDLDQVSSSEEEQSENDDQGEDDQQSDSDEDSDVEDKKSKLLKINAQARQTLSKSYTASQTKDALKGYSIIQQNKFFDNIIDSRIKLQKAINVANTLPITGKSWDLLNNSKTEKLINENMDLLSTVLNKIVDIRLLLQKNDKINTSDSAQSKEIGHKRSFENVRESTQTLDSQLNKYRKVVLYKWSNKINQTQGVGSSGAATNGISSKKFSAINQTSDVQVETQLADQQRLLKRTFLNRRGVVPMNFEEDYKSGSLSKLKPTDSQQNSDMVNDDEDNIDIPKNYNPRLKSNIDTSENPYIFDDEDFYRVLLNDLVDKKINNANNTNSSSSGAGQQQVRLITSSTNKVKNKNIDTKASKGRKLNFQIQEPIAHYEAPVGNQTKWSDEQIDEFFAGLLGQGINFNEEDEEVDNNESDEDVENIDGSNAEELENIKNDDIKIFG